ncbi:MAG: Hpt domain-containing protein [Devosia sp.]|nr:Hpt domain-containing protein [Devosia sp.]
MAQNTAFSAPQVETSPRLRSMRPIDLVHLARQCLGDERLELEILGLFDTTIATYYAQLHAASAHDDLAMSLHAIKGAAGGVGAWVIADMARALEAELRAGRPLAPERIDDLGLAVEDARSFIARMIAAAQSDA